MLYRPIEQTGILTEKTGKIWYEDLVGGVRELGKEELPPGAVFGLDFQRTFVINTQVYLNWYVSISAPSYLPISPLPYKMHQSTYCLTTYVN
jgi:hypothetical protein